MQWWTRRQLQKGNEVAKIKALSRCVDGSYVPLIVNCCLKRGQRPDVMRAATVALGRLAPKSVTIVLHGIEQNRFYENEELVQALIETGAPEVPHFLVQRLKQRPDHPLRLTFIKHLADLRHTEVVPVLLDILHRPEIDGQTKAFAIDALGVIGDLSAVPELARTSHDAGLRSHAKNALEKLGWQPNGGGRFKLAEEDEIELRLDTVVSAIWDVYKDPKLRSGEAIAKAIARLGDPKYYQVLPEILVRADYKEDVRGSVAEALGAKELTVPLYNCVDRLIPILKNETIPRLVRGRVATALGRIGNAAATGALRELLLGLRGNSKELWFLSRVLEGLVTLNTPPDPIVLELVLDMLEDRNYVHNFTDERQNPMVGSVLRWLSTSEIQDPQLVRRRINHLMAGCLDQGHSLPVEPLFHLFSKVDAGWSTWPESAALIPEVMEKFKRAPYHQRLVMLKVLSVMGDERALMPMIDNLQSKFRGQYNQTDLRETMSAARSVLGRTIMRITDADLRIVSGMRDLKAEYGKDESDDVWRHKYQWSREAVGFSDLRQLAQDELKRRSV